MRRELTRITKPLVGLSVLAIDDDADSRELVAAILERAGASVVTACGSDEALQLCESRHFDVIVSDLMMPELCGIELLARIRHLEGARATPAMALSAGGPTLERQARAAGFERVERKPITPQCLIAAVASLSRGPSDSDTHAAAE